MNFIERFDHIRFVVIGNSLNGTFENDLCLNDRCMVTSLYELLPRVEAKSNIAYMFTSNVIIVYYRPSGLFFRETFTIPRRNGHIKMGQRKFASPLGFYF